MDLDALRLFVAVVQAGSLSSAAGRLGVPLPTLSRRIRELERSVKVQLLERSTRGTTPTPEGTALFEQAGRGVELLVDAMTAVTSNQSSLRGRLRISIPPTFEPWWQLLGDFQRLYPDIQLSVFTSERRVDLIEDGIDVALRVGELADESVVARRLTTYRHVLVASPRLLARLGAPQSPEDLLRFPCGAWNAAPGVDVQWRLGSEVVAPRAILSTNDYAQLRVRAIAGDLITELPPFAVAGALRGGQLEGVLAGYPLPEQTVTLLYASHRYPSSIVRTYLDYCQSHAAAAISGLEETST